MSHLTTHVLDAAAGCPAANVAVSLGRYVDGVLEPLAQGLTDDDGRAALGPDVLEPGIYGLTFGTGAYFGDRGQECFYPLVTVTFTVAERSHYHVPLLLSPFGYSTYRGS